MATDDLFKQKVLVTDSVQEAVKFIGEFEGGPKSRLRLTHYRLICTVGACRTAARTHASEIWAGDEALSIENDWTNATRGLSRYLGLIEPSIFGKVLGRLLALLAQCGLDAIAMVV